MEFGLNIYHSYTKLISYEKTFSFLFLILFIQVSNCETTDSLYLKHIYIPIYDHGEMYILIEPNFLLIIKDSLLNKKTIKSTYILDLSNTKLEHLDILGHFDKSSNKLNFMIKQSFKSFYNNKSLSVDDFIFPTSNNINIKSNITTFPWNNKPFELEQNINLDIALLNTPYDSSITYGLAVIFKPDKFVKTTWTYDNVYFFEDSGILCKDVIYYIYNKKNKIIYFKEKVILKPDKTKTTIKKATKK